MVRGSRSPYTKARKRTQASDADSPTYIPGRGNPPIIPGRGRGGGPKIDHPGNPLEPQKRQAQRAHRREKREDTLRGPVKAFRKSLLEAERQPTPTGAPSESNAPKTEEAQ